MARTLKSTVTGGAGSQGRRTSASALVCLGLALAAIVVYLPVWRHEFVLYDDPEYVAGNRMVQSGLTWAGIKWAFTTFHSSNWHPITWLSHMLDVQLFGPGPAWPHAVNVLIHVANTILLFVLLQRFTGALWRSALVAALFALHPLHVESVAWVAERKDVLSAFFGLWALLAYRSYTTHRTYRTYIASLVFFALGLMSKPMLVTLPFVMLLLDYWPLGRVAGVGGEPAARVHVSRFTLQSLVWEKIPFVILSAISCVVTFLAQRQGGAVGSLAALPMDQRLANAAVSYARYLAKTFWPTDLAFFYPHPGRWPVVWVILSGIVLAGLCVAVWKFRRRFPSGVTGWFWFCGMLIPVIGLVQAGAQSMADRYTYLPLIGVFILIVWGAGELVARGGLPRVAVGIAAGLAVTACAARTRNQLQHWRTSDDLFRHAIAVTKNNSVAENNLGNLLFDAGEVDDAMVHYRRALEIQPGYADAHINLGRALLTKQQPDQAIAHFEQALRILPADASGHNNLGNALLSRGRVDEAIAHYQQALKIQPDFAQAHNNLGWSLLQNRNVDEAIVHFEKALELEPDYANAHNNLGFALLQKGRTGEAVAHCERALVLQPDDVSALSNLAWLRATCPDSSVRDGAKAIALAEKASELSAYRDPATLRSLAAAYAESGRWTDAVNAARQGLRLAEQQSDAELAEALRAHIKRYEAGAPFRDPSLSPGPTNSSPM